MNDIKNFDNIERYLLGALDESATLQFEKAMQQDPPFAQDVRIYTDLLQGIHIAGDEELAQSIERAEIALEEQGYFEAFKDQLDQDVIKGINATGDQQLSDQIQLVEKKIDGEGFFTAPAEKEAPTPLRKTAKTRSLFSMRNLAVAASVLLLISAGFYFFSQPGGDNYDALFAQYNQVDHGVLDKKLTALHNIGFVTENRDQKLQLRTMLTAYKTSSDPARKLQLTTDFLTEYPNDPTALFFQGRALMKLEDYQAAASRFAPLAQTNDFDGQTDALWYQAMCWLKIAHKRPEVPALFRQVARNTSSPYAAPATEILNKMEGD